MILPSDLASKHPPQRTKPWLDIDQQVAKLEMRGLPLDDSQWAFSRLYRCLQISDPAAAAELA